MNIALYLGAAAMGTLERWQESIASNIAASSTPGYRKEEVGFSVTPSGSIATGAARGASSAISFPTVQHTVNFTPGQIVGTGRDLDVAIQGDGFFEVQLPDGTRGYTRSGSFYTNSDRQLVDAQGRQVSGEGGSGIQLLPEGGAVNIARDGTITQGGQPIGRLAVYQFDNPQTLQAVSGGLFLAGSEAPHALEQPSLEQGSLETSNVQPVGEMVNLIRASRAYEAAQKVITSRDDTMDKTIRTFS